MARAAEWWQGDAKFEARYLQSALYFRRAPFVVSLSLVKTALQYHQSYTGNLSALGFRSNTTLMIQNLKQKY